MRARALIGALVGALVCATAAGAAAWTSSTAQGSATFAAAPAFPPLVDKVPEILGVAQIGSPLLATDGAFGPDPTARVVTWLRCDAQGAACVATGGATASTVLQAADAGATFRVEVTPVNAGVPGPAVRSEASLPVSAISLTGMSQPLLTTTPTVTGTPTVGAPLTAGNGTWNGVVTSYAYAWQRCDAYGRACVAIAGATARAYTPQPADRGLRLRVAVSASTLSLLPGTAISPASARVL